MSKKLYRIIWIDDQCKTNPGFILNARQQDIIVTAFEFVVDGIKELEKNYALYDGIVLDVKCLYDSHDEALRSMGFYEARKAISTLSAKKNLIIPCYVYSGQPDYHSSEEFMNYLNKEKLYTKGDDDNLLIEDIKRAADMLPSTIIRQKYLYAVGKLPDNVSAELIDILSYVEDDITDNPDVFPKIRVIINWLMDQLNDYGILAVKHNGANINACSVYLGKKELKDIVPIHIQRSLHSCVDVCNNGSHRIEIFRTVQNGNAPFLIRSTVFELLNILRWYCTLPKDEESINLIRSVVAGVYPDGHIIEGELKKDENEVYYCENCMIHPDKLDECGISLGDWIRITETTESKGRYASRYPRFAKKVELQ